jgi:hypothetical protein
MSADRGIHQIAAQRPKPRKRAILVCALEAAIAGDIGSQDCDELPGLGHSSLIPLGRRRWDCYRDLRETAMLPPRIRRI